MATTVKTDNTPHRKNAYAGTGAPKAPTKNLLKSKIRQEGQQEEDADVDRHHPLRHSHSRGSRRPPYFTSGARQAAVIKIPRHADTRMLADTLTKYFGESYSRRTAFIFSRLASDPAQRYGAYEIPMGTSPSPPPADWHAAPRCR